MINPGTLVLTAEGYYAIVLERPTSDGYVDIFTCNGPVAPACRFAR